MSIQDFIDGYIDTLAWVERDEIGGASLADSARASIEEVCRDFYAANQHLFDDDHRAGQDFYLTRNRHGAGFWDGDYPDGNGRVLTDAAHAYGDSTGYLGDDGLVYVG